MNASSARVERSATDAEYIAASVEAVVDYRQRYGWRLIDAPLRSKNPARNGWQYEPHDADELRRRFGVQPRNACLLTGACSANTIDTDLDVTEAIAAADSFFPPTTQAFGRPGRRRAHRLYVLDGNGTVRRQTWTDPVHKEADGKPLMLLELRGDGHQTVIPPSLHEDTGDPITWDERGEPTIASLDKLMRAAHQTAAAAMLARHYPGEGIRHDYRLALAGYLLRGGLSAEDAERLMSVSARVAGADAHDAAAAVRDTAAALAAGKHATGGPRLAELLADGEAVVARLRQWLDLRTADESSEPVALRVVTVAELMTVPLRPRETVVAPVLFSQSLNMLFAKRGIGKTHVALGIAYAAASAGTFLRYHAPRAHRTLIIDGEMPAVVLRERLAGIIDASEGEPPDPSYLRILSADMQDRSLPDLATQAGQRAIESHLDRVEFLILDNLSALVRGTGDENGAEAWLPVQDWSLSLRRRGVVVLLVHHAGQSGNQRGTSKREDLLDSIIELRRPRDYEPTQGARFEVHLTKARGVYGADAEPFEAALVTNEDGKFVWTICTMDDRLTAQVADMVRDGETYRDIAKALGTTKSTVERHARKARERVLI